tara:strand:+ start:166 stop:372 length:207 start_codon:yes stop_codon:yes gene_type:complete
MEKYEGKTFVFNGTTIKIITIGEDGSGALKIGNNFQNATKEDIEFLVQNGTEIAEACDMSEGCVGCGS